MLTAELLVKYFDFRKEKDICNVIGCENPYYHDLAFHEFDLKLARERELARVKICKEHENLVRNLLKKLNRESIKHRKVVKARIL